MACSITAQALADGALVLGDQPRQGCSKPGTRNLVAIALRPGAGRLRIEIPEPEPNSAFDVMELERIKKPANK
jgi:hypothetical protein